MKSELSDAWRALAKDLGITLPETFYTILDGYDTRTTALAWRFISPFEAQELQTDLYRRYPIPERTWYGLPFAISTTSEDVVCFDLTTPEGEIARVLPIRDWHGPRWEYLGEKRDFEDWLRNDYIGFLT